MVVRDTDECGVGTGSESAVSSNVSVALERVRQLSGSPGRGAFMARALEALARIASETDERALTEATGARTDFDVLLQALETPEALTHLDDPLASAKIRGLQQRERLLNAEGGVIAVDDVASALRITRQAVDKRRRAGRLIAISAGRRGYAYPVWQLDSASGTLPGLEEVLAELGGHDQWMRMTFMLNPNARLDGATPLAVLRDHDVERVKRAAQAYGKHGAV